MWPSADFDRIRTAILDARTRGVRSQVDGVSHRSSLARFRKKHAMVYDRVSEADPGQGNPLSWDYAPGSSGPAKVEHTFEADTYPIPILLRRPPLPETSPVALGTEAVVNLVIDAAGKVRSASLEGKTREGFDKRHCKLEVYSRLQRGSARRQPSATRSHTFAVKAIQPRKACRYSWGAGKVAFSVSCSRQG
jgi:hypothetical protein